MIFRSTSPVSQAASVPSMVSPAVTKPGPTRLDDIRNCLLRIFSDTFEMYNSSCSLRNSLLVLSRNGFDLLLTHRYFALRHNLVKTHRNFKLCKSSWPVVLPGFILFKAISGSSTVSLWAMTVDRSSRRSDWTKEICCRNPHEIIVH